VVAAAEHEPGEPPEAEQHAHHRPRPGPVAGDEPVERDPDRNGGDQECCYSTGRSVLLTDRDHPVPEEREHQAEQGRAGELGAGDVQVDTADLEQHGEQSGGHEEAAAHPEQRRHLSHHDPDREVRRAPHDVDDPERDEDRPELRPHRHTDLLRPDPCGRNARRTSDYCRCAQVG